MATPSKELELLAIKALKAKIAADKAAAEYEDAKLNFEIQAQKEDLLNPDLQAVGPVATSIQQNRYFDIDTAIALLPEEVVEESKVTVVDAKLLQQHMTPIQKEAAMMTHKKPFKISFKVNK